MPNYQRRIVYLSEAQREELFSNGSITVNGTTIAYDANDMYVTPQEEPYVKPASGIPASDLASGVVPDVRINETSIIQNGIANIPTASYDNYGVVRTSADYGISINSLGRLYNSAPTDAQIKEGTNQYRAITSVNQHKATFYGLAKAAGDTTQSQSDNAVGTYTDTAKTAIQTMLGVPGDVQINGTSIVSNGVANIPMAGASPGVAKVSSNLGVNINSDGYLTIGAASSAIIKEGISPAYPIAPNKQNEAVFYGLAKLAGADMASSSNPVGTYTDAAKTAIQTMLGIDAVASTKANKNNTVITGSLSMGRLANSTVVENSTALGYNSTASSVYAFSSGYNNVSSGAFSTTVGYNNTAYGKASFSGGMGTATGPSGEAAFAYGRGISSQGSYMTGFGLYSIVPTLFPEWVAGTSYSVGDRVTNSIYGYECITANSDSTFNGSKWKTLWYNCDTAFVIGNGSGTSSERSNAFKIDIDGNVYLGKDIYINCNANSTGGTKLESGVSFVETVSGTTPSITGEPNTRYMCGEVTSIAIVSPSAGTIDVVFTSGSTPAVLTVTPPTGMTIKWPAWFDPTSLATNTTYEINIMDGVYGAVMAW